MNKNYNIKTLKQELGKDYQIVSIDFETCLYRDFQNGFNVEISGIGHGNSKKPLALFLWWGSGSDCIQVKCIYPVEKTPKAISNAVEELKKYSEQLVTKGLTSRDKLYDMLYDNK